MHASVPLSCDGRRATARASLTVVSTPLVSRRSETLVMHGPLSFSLFAVWAFSYFGGYAIAAPVHLLLLAALVVLLFRFRAPEER